MKDAVSFKFDMAVLFLRVEANTLEISMEGRVWASSNI